MTFSTECQCLRVVVTLTESSLAPLQVWVETIMLQQAGPLPEQVKVEDEGVEVERSGPSLSTPPLGRERSRDDDPFSCVHQGGEESCEVCLQDCYALRHTVEDA